MDLDIPLLLSVTGGLGRQEEQPDGSAAFVQDDDCLECLKDIQRFLRQDDSESRQAFFALGQFNLAKNALMPLITTYPDDTDLVYNALKVVTWLTMPLEPGSDNPSLQIANMQAVKEAALAQDALKVIVDLVAEPLARHPRMSEKDALIVQLVVTFFRNLLAVPDARSTSGSRGDHRTRLRGELLQRLADDHVLELLLVFAQHTDVAPFKSEAALLLEVFHAVFNDLQPGALLAARAVAAARQAAPPLKAADATSGGGGLPAGKASGASRQPQAGSAAQRAAQLGDKMAMRAAKQAVPRHARFGATYVLRAPDGQTGPRVNPAAVRLSELPPPPKGSKKPHAADAGATMAPLPQRLLATMAGYAEQFLGASYDVLLGNVRKELEGGLGLSRLHRNDFVRFMQLASFFTCYTRLKHDQELAKPAEEGKDGAGKAGDAKEKENRPGGAEGAEAAEMAAEDGKSAGGAPPAGPESPFAAISASMGWDTFHLVHKTWLEVIDVPPSSAEKDWELQHVATALLRQMLAVLDAASDSGTASDRRAADRLQRRLLHDDMKESGLLPVLARLVKGFSARHSPRAYAVDLVAALHTTLRLLTRLNSSEQGGFLVKRRAAGGGGGGPRRRKSVATPPGSPGKDAATDDAAVDSAAGGASAKKGAPKPGEAAERDGADERGWDGGDEEEGGSSAGSGDEGCGAGRATRHDPFAEEEEETRRATREVVYNMKQRVRQELAFPAVVHFYSWLLHGYASNGRETNHHLISFLQRIAHPEHGLNLEPMLYQLTVLRVFNRICSDVDFLRSSDGREVGLFVKKVLRNMFARIAPPGAAPAAAATDAATADAAAGAEKAAEAPGGAEEVEEWPGGGGEGGGGAGADSDEAVAAAKRKAQEQQVKAKECAGRLIFLELLFWKNARDAEVVRDEYQWRIEHGSGDARVQAIRAAFADGSDGEGGGGARAQPRGGPIFSSQQDVRLTELFEKFCGRTGYLDAITAALDAGVGKAAVGARLKALGLKRGVLTGGQEAKLRAAWDEHGGAPGATAAIAAELGLKKAAVSRHLKALGLKRGVLTVTQEREMREAYEKNKEGPHLLEGIATDMAFRFTRAQISRHLKKLGLPVGRRSKKGGDGPAWDGSSSDGSGSDSGAGSGSDSDAGGSVSDAEGGAASGEEGGCAALGSGSKPAKKKRRQADGRAAAGGRGKGGKKGGGHKPALKGMSLSAGSDGGGSDAAGSDSDAGGVAESDASAGAAAAAGSDVEEATAARSTSSGGSGSDSDASASRPASAAAARVGGAKASPKQARKELQKRAAAQKLQRKRAAARKPPLAADSDSGSEMELEAEPASDSEAGASPPAAASPSADGAAASPASGSRRASGGGGGSQRHEGVAISGAARKRLEAIRAARRKSGGAAAAAAEAAPASSGEAAAPPEAAASPPAAAASPEAASPAVAASPAAEAADRACTRPAKQRRLLKKASPAADAPVATSGLDDLEDF